MYQVGAIEKLEKTESEAKARLAQVRTNAAVYETVSRALEEAKRRWASMKKVVPTEDDTKATIDYLNRVLGAKASLKNLQFRFIEEQETPLARFNRYFLQGEGEYRNLYSFIWKLENGRPLYKIQNLGLEQIWWKMEDDKVIPAVKFNMTLDAYFNPNKPGVEVDLTEPQRRGSIGFDPFRPLVHSQVPPNTEGLPELGDNSVLLALTPNSAIIQDESGKTFTVELGGRVYLGVLKKISLESDTAEFELNEAGIYRRVVLRLD
jgi:Tfp pilus assembly protein PilO